MYMCKVVCNSESELAVQREKITDGQNARESALGGRVLGFNWEIEIGHFQKCAEEGRGQH